MTRSEPTDAFRSLSWGYDCELRSLRAVQVKHWVARSGGPPLSKRSGGNGLGPLRLLEDVGKSPPKALLKTSEEVARKHTIGSLLL